MNEILKELINYQINLLIILKDRGSILNMEEPSWPGKRQDRALRKKKAEKASLNLSRF